MLTASAAAAWAGIDIREATRMAIGEIPQLPVLPILASRGIGADAVGRTTAMLADLPMDVSPRAWRLSHAVGRAGRRAADFLARDLDAMEEAVEIARGTKVDGAGPGAAVSGLLAVRLELTGPWTLAARVELPSGRPVLSDAGARRDLAESLREGVSSVVARLSSRLETPVRVVLHEPDLWRVIAGAVPAPSELDPVAPIPAERATGALSRFAEQLRQAAGSARLTAVVLFAPGRTTPGVSTHFSTLKVTEPGTDGLDGLVMLAADVLPWAGAARPHGWADGSNDPEAHALLDRLGEALDNGGLVELHSVHKLCGRSAALPSDYNTAEVVAAAVVGLLDRLKVDRMQALAQLTLSAGTQEMAGSAAERIRALEAARFTAEVLPRIAE